MSTESISLYQASNYRNKYPLTDDGELLVKTINEVFLTGSGIAALGLILSAFVIGVAVGQGHAGWSNIHMWKGLTISGGLSVMGTVLAATSLYNMHSKLSPREKEKFIKAK